MRNRGANDPPAVIPAPKNQVGGTFIPVDPADSDRVFVEVVSYNSHFYYVQGDVATPGRLPITGNETVLDALQFAGGFVQTAEPKNIHLNRPAQGGKPAKDYPIDYHAILEGKAEANLQIFAGDRLVVGRNPIVQKTIEIDRASAATNSVINTMLQYAVTARALASVNAPADNSLRIKIGGQTLTIGLADPKPMTPAARDAMIKDWVDFLWSAAEAEKGANLDEKAFREAVMRRLAPEAMPPARK